jgi:hypothetical protein
MKIWYSLVLGVAIGLGYNVGVSLTKKEVDACQKELSVSEHDRKSMTQMYSECYKSFMEQMIHEND